MSKDQWSSEWSNAPEGEKIEWPKPDIKKAPVAEWIQPIELSKEQVQAKWPEPKTGVEINQIYQAGWDIAKPNSDQTAITIIENGEIKKVYNNRMPTHDPYVNPDSHIYYQCGCGAILDPGTKSFASLNNAASSEGWKVRWNKNGQGYQPFCVKCGEGVE